MLTQYRNETFDAVVIGARCAGAATAMLLARGGARVLLIDRDSPGTDTMSTHALMRGAVLQLQAWGVLRDVIATGAPVIRRTAFIYGPEHVDVDIRPMFGSDGLIAPRRALLDAALVRAAGEAGVVVRHRTAPIDLIVGRDGTVEGVHMRTGDGPVISARAAIVIGADGRRSWVARQVRAETLRQSRNMTASVYGYFDGMSPDGYRWHYAPGVGGAVIPTNDGKACVALSVTPGEFRSHLRGQGEEGFRAFLAKRLPQLDAEMAAARLSEGLIAFAGEPGFVRRSQGAGWALVGDAGYFKDPVTAHGITDALRDAQILAHSVLEGRVADYPEIRDSLTGRFFELTDRIAGLDWSLDELKELHLKLNTAMKETQNWISGLHYPIASAA